MLTTSVTLNNGVKMPIFGFGTFKVEDGKQIIDAVKYALQIGYRHIDTAAIYQNEEGVGQAIIGYDAHNHTVYETGKYRDRALKELAELGIEVIDTLSL